MKHQCVINACCDLFVVCHRFLSPTRPGSPESQAKCSSPSMQLHPLAMHKYEDIDGG